MPQGGGGIRGPQQAVAGSSITIEVANGATSVEVGVTGDPASAASYPVGPDGKVTIPVPVGTAGEELIVRPCRVRPPVSITIPIISLA